MIRHRNLISIIAAVALTAVSAGDVFGRGGGMGGMGGHGGMGMGMAGGRGMGMGMVGGRGIGMGPGIGAHAAFARPAMGTFSGARPLGFHGNRFGFHNNFGFRHHFPFRRHFVRNRFFFGAFPFAYASYDDGCYQHVWTHWGWRWINVCYY